MRAAPEFHLRYIETVSPATLNELNLKRERERGGGHTTNSTNIYKVEAIMHVCLVHDTKWFSLEEIKSVKVHLCPNN